MIPGKTYVGRLPGHSRKAFVRKREYKTKRISRLADVPAAQSFGQVRFYEDKRGIKMPRWLRSMFGSDYEYYDDHYRKRKVIYTDSAHHRSPTGRTSTSTRQTCSACGKFRSPSWSARHPLRYGEIPRPSLCRKCVGKSTSSAETPGYPRRPRRYSHRSHPCYSDCTEGLYSSHDSTDPCHLRRRYKSDSLGYIRPRSLARSGSADRVNITIQNNGFTPKSRVRTMSSSNDAVRVIHRISVDRPVRCRTLRSKSSDVAFTDEVVEEVFPRRRPLSYAR